MMSFAAFGALTVVSRLACLLRESDVHRLATIVGWGWFFLVRYRRHVMEDNIRLAFPEASESERRILCKKACVHLVQTLVEFLRLPLYRRHGLSRVVRIDGLEEVDAALAKGRGLLCVTGHLGSFELAAAAAAERIGTHRVGVVAKSFTEGVDRFVDGMRAQSGLVTFSAKDSLYSVLRALRQNSVVIFVLDQNATRAQGVLGTFFGHPALTMASLARIARRTGICVVGAETWREPDGHRLKIHPPIPSVSEGPTHDAIAKTTQRYTDFIESSIRRHPEQWLWTHKRFRTQPAPDDRAATNRARDA